VIIGASGGRLGPRCAESFLEAPAFKRRGALDVLPRVLGAEHDGGWRYPETVLARQPYALEGLLVADPDLAEATGLLARRYRPT
jgi:hypothetical protein